MLFLACAGILLGACNQFNEPFVLLPLAVTTFRDGGAGTISTHVYKGGKIQSFTKTAGSDTVVSLQFQYQGDRLNTIMKDSSSAGYDLIMITGFGSEVTIDSTFSVAGEVTTLKEVRKHVYDVNHLLERIDVTTWGATPAAQRAWEYDWTDGNVSEIRALGISEGTETVEQVITVTYDDRMGVFSSDIPYIYTLSPTDLYWLSANNPLRFKRDGGKETKYGYFYNLKSYPSRIITDTNDFLNCTYAELR